MGFVIKVHALDHTDIEGFYTGEIKHYRDVEVAVPSVVDDKESNHVKVYKRKKNAENAMNKILYESSFVRKCSVEEY